MADFDPDAFIAGKSDAFDPDAFIGMAAPTEPPPPIMREPMPEREWHEEWLPGGEASYRARLSPEQQMQALLDEYRKRSEGDTSRLTNLIKGATLGAAPMISRASARVQDAGLWDFAHDPIGTISGKSPKSDDEVNAFYKEQDKAINPFEAMAWQSAGAAPAAMAVRPFSAAAGGIVNPTLLGKAAQALAPGVDASMLAGAQGYLSSEAGTDQEGRGWDAAAMATAGAPLAFGLPIGATLANELGPPIQRGVRDFVGSKPASRALDKLKSMLAGETQKPTPNAVDAALAPDEVTQLTPFKNFLKDEFGGNPPDFPSRDPKFLDKSGELAEMLGQGKAKPPVDADTPAFGFSGQKWDNPRQPITQSVPLDPEVQAAQRARMIEETNAIAAKKMDAQRAAEQILDENGIPTIGAEGRDNIAKMSRENEDELSAAMFGRGGLGNARPANDAEMAAAEQALANLRRQGLSQHIDVGGKGTNVGTQIADTQSVTPPQQMPQTQIGNVRGQSDETVIGGQALRSAPDRAPAAGPERDQARIDRGRARMMALAKLAGGAMGAMGGNNVAGGLGAIPGAMVGAAGGARALRGAERGAIKMDELGQKLQGWLTDPDKLVQLEAQGGGLGKAASFVIGNNDPAGISARAFIVAQAPWFRELLSGERR